MGGLGRDDLESNRVGAVLYLKFLNGSISSVASSFFTFS
jgi:hypothetical protein